MEFKFSPQINEKLIKRMQDKPFTHYGYACTTPEQNEEIVKYVNGYAKVETKKEWLSVWKSILTMFRCVLTACTK